jgi:hypothetical protein
MRGRVIPRGRRGAAGLGRLGKDLRPSVREAAAFPVALAAGLEVRVFLRDAHEVAGGWFARNA